MSNPFSPGKALNPEMGPSRETLSFQQTFAGAERGIVAPQRNPNPWERPWPSSWPEPTYISGKEQDAERTARKDTLANAWQVIGGGRSLGDAYAEQKRIESEKRDAVQNARAEVNAVFENAWNGHKENLGKTLRGEQSVVDAWKESARINSEKDRALLDLGAEPSAQKYRYPWEVYY